MYTVIVTLPTEDVRFELRSIFNVKLVIARLIESNHMDKKLDNFFCGGEEIFECENVTVIKDPYF